MHRHGRKHIFKALRLELRGTVPDVFESSSDDKAVAKDFASVLRQDN